VACVFVHYDGRETGLPHNPFKACVVPRPIGWISTVDPEGNRNLAPFSFFNAVSEQPPTVMFCANGPHLEGGEKDSVRNARATGEFVVNLATWELRQAVNTSSKRVPHGFDEFDLAELDSQPSLLVRPPRVAATPIALECKVVAIHELPGEEINRMVVGRVLGIHIADELLVHGHVSIPRLRPIARLGYREYAVVNEVFEMSRPRDWPD
jgi:flavin reductase (DIM6/NTAB) family NADH-FMN oxidoreductase RutF